MTSRILLIIAMVVVAISQAHAGGPFSRLLGSRRYTNPVQSVPPSSRGVTLSPEQMTKIYGPSILVRDVVKTQKTKPEKPSRFVTQP